MELVWAHRCTVPSSVLSRARLSMALDLVILVRLSMSLVQLIELFRPSSRVVRVVFRRYMPGQLLVLIRSLSLLIIIQLSKIS